MIPQKYVSILAKQNDLKLSHLPHLIPTFKPQVVEKLTRVQARRNQEKSGAAVRHVRHVI